MKKSERGEILNAVLGDHWPRFFAHRGASTLAPENTLASFALARKLGSRGVEFDVHQARTGELVVAHDHWLDRIAARHLKIEDLSYAELSEIDIGSFFSRTHPEVAEGSFAGGPFSGERIPTLDMVLETLGTEIACDVELKAEGFHCDRLATAVARTLERHGRKNCIVSSFNPFAIRAYRRVGSLPTAAIYCPYPSVPFLMRHRECLFLSGADIKKPAIETALASRSMETGTKPVIVWTVDSPEDAARLFAGGVRSVITNRIQDFI